jgi:chromosome segregation ATPase
VPVLFLEGGLDRDRDSLRMCRSVKTFCLSDFPMTKRELELEVEKLKKTLSRARSKTKGLCEDLKEAEHKIKIHERNLVRLNKSNDSIISKNQSLSNKLKIIEEKNAELAESCDKIEEQNKNLRKKIALATASSTEPRYEMLKQNKVNLSSEQNLVDRVVLAHPGGNPYVG